MKAPKYIVSIAKKFVDIDAENYDFIMNDKESWLGYYIKSLMSVRKAILNGRLYLGVESVSSSGMSRVIKIKYIENNTLFGVEDFIYELAGCDKNNRIRGCGMDMLFEAQYNLFQALCPNMGYQDKMPQYNSL